MEEGESKIKGDGWMLIIHLKKRSQIEWKKCCVCERKKDLVGVFNPPSLHRKEMDATFFASPWQVHFFVSGVETRIYDWNSLNRSP